MPAVVVDKPCIFTEKVLDLIRFEPRIFVSVTERGVGLLVAVLSEFGGRAIPYVALSVIVARGDGCFYAHEASGSVGRALKIIGDRKLINPGF